MPERQANDMLTMQQIADDWNISLRTVQRYVAKKKLKVTRLPGGQPRIRRADAEAALTETASA